MNWDDFDEVLSQLEYTGPTRVKEILKQSDLPEGEFNGTDVRVYIATNNNKVYRIMVASIPLILLLTGITNPLLAMSSSV